MKLKFFLTFITRILKANPKVTLKIFLSLFLLSVTQACLIFFVKGFLDSFFIVDQNQVNINILQLLPVKITPIVYKFFPQVNFMVRRQLAIFFIPILIALAASARALILLTYSVSQSQFSALLTHQARTVIFTKIINQPFLDLAIVSPARWMSVVMNDVNFLQNKVTDFMTVFLRGFFVVASSFLALNFLQPATAYCLLVAGLFLVLLGARVGKKISSYSDFFQRQMAQISSHILNIRERFAFIKAQKGELFEAKKLNTLIDDYYSVMRRSIFIRASFAPTLEFLGFFMLAIFIALQQRNYFSQSINSENILPFFVALGLVFKPLKDIGEQFTKLKETLGALTQFEQILTAEPVQLRKTYTDLSSEQFDITFQYDEKAFFNFREVNLTPGKMIAVIGPSGAGKSTLVRCLAGLLSSTNLNSSYVSQIPFLFSGTLRENLIYGLDYKPTDEFLFEYFEEFKMMHLINGLKFGLSSHFEALKDHLSGGEKQRLTIIRALLQNKKILLLDEVTAALDSDLEKEILLIIQKITHQKNIATLLITHRYENLGLFDAVWRVEDRLLIKEIAQASL